MNTLYPTSPVEFVAHCKLSLLEVLSGPVPFLRWLERQTDAGDEDLYTYIQVVTQHAGVGVHALSLISRLSAFLDAALPDLPMDVLQLELVEKRLWLYISEWELLILPDWTNAVAMFPGGATLESAICMVQGICELETIERRQEWQSLTR